MLSEAAPICTVEQYGLASRAGERLATPLIFRSQWQLRRVANEG
jgi:hypothetical protein